MDDLRAKYFSVTKGDFFLDSNKLEVQTYLRERCWLGESIDVQEIEKPGAGNMNLVLRITLDNQDSFVLKQARPWVEKYPSIEAPLERIEVEYEYYSQLGHHSFFEQYSPEIIGFDRKNFLMLMEDLGKASDFSWVYSQGSSFTTRDLNQAIAYLNRLKQLPQPKHYPLNIELRKLNHQHIFVLPFQPGAVELEKTQPELVPWVNECQKDELLIKRIVELGEIYLSSGNQLLHGDFYPGSLLNADSGLKVIDPEFSFMGPEEWDIAVFTAHLILSSTTSGQLKAVVSGYQQSSSFNESHFAGFTGVEVLRRLLGLAQVPVELSSKQKSNLISQAINWIKIGKIDTLSSYEEYLLSN